jgi:hypothetical protein
MNGHVPCICCFHSEAFVQASSTCGLWVLFHLGQVNIRWLVRKAGRVDVLLGNIFEYHVWQEKSVSG